MWGTNSLGVLQAVSGLPSSSTPLEQLTGSLETAQFLQEDQNKNTQITRNLVAGTLMNSVDKVENVGRAYRPPVKSRV